MSFAHDPTSARPSEVVIPTQLPCEVYAGGTGFWSMRHQHMAGALPIRAHLRSPPVPQAGRHRPYRAAIGHAGLQAWIWRRPALGRAFLRGPWGIRNTAHQSRRGQFVSCHHVGTCGGGRPATVAHFGAVVALSLLVLAATAYARTALAGWLLSRFTIGHGFWRVPR